MTRRKLAFSTFAVFQFLFFIACFKTVTTYKTEPVAMKVVKYRTVSKPGTQEVQIPYQEEIKIPQYRITKKAKLNPGAEKSMALAFLPFSSSTGNPADGHEVSELLRNAVAGHAESGNKYLIIDSSQVRSILGTNELKNLKAQDIRKLRDSFGVEAVISGHVKNHTDANLTFRVEAIAVQAMKILFGETVSGNTPAALHQALGLFFDEKVLAGYKTEVLTKIRTETRTAYQDVQEAYEVTEYKDRQVAHEEKKKTFIGYALEAVAYPIGAALFVFLITR